MKTTPTMIAIIGSLLLCSLNYAVAESSSEASKPGWFKQAFGSLSWDEVVSVVESPRDICSRVSMHVRYKADNPLIDIWLGGRETWDQGHGDCEDMAACVKELCVKKGFEASVYAIYTTAGKQRFQAHAVVIGKWHGETWISSNGSFCSCKILDEARKRIVSSLGWDANSIVMTPISHVTSLTAQNKGTKNLEKL